MAIVYALINSKRPTKHAVDWRDSARFTSIFLASGFFCSQTFSQPARQRVPITALVKGPKKTIDFLSARSNQFEPREQKTPTALFLSQFILEQATLRHPRHCL
jgi:hypothetical protein